MDARGERPTAEPITAVVAEHVRRHRIAAGLSQAELGDEMARRGMTRWKRATVINLEQRASGSRGQAPGRDAVTVDEWLMLARVLRVPPLLLIADPRQDSPVPIEGHDTPAWEALMWLAGENDGADPRLVGLGLRLGAAISDLSEPYSAVANLRRSASRDGREPTTEALDRARLADESRHRQALYELQFVLLGLQRAGAPIPDRLDREGVLRRAEELGVADEYQLNAILRDGRQVI